MSGDDAERPEIVFITDDSPPPESGWAPSAPSAPLGAGRIPVAPTLEQYLARIPEDQKEGTPGPFDAESVSDVLNPRQLKLCELAAIGRAPGEIARELGYSNSRVSVLLSQPAVKLEIQRIRNRVFEESIGKELKKMGRLAIDEIYRCITHQGAEYKADLRVQTAKWLAEMIDGKATQKFDIGENLLGSVMERLDAMKAAGVSLNPQIAAQREVIDVSPGEASPAVEAAKSESEPPKESELSEQERLDAWIRANLDRKAT